MTVIPDPDEDAEADAVAAAIHWDQAVETQGRCGSGLRPAAASFPGGRGTAGARPVMGITRRAPQLTEDEFFEQVRDLLNRLPLLWYHTFDSRKSNKGFPDLVVCGIGGVLYRELKTADGSVSPAQKKWLQALADAGQDAGIWRPDDVESQRVWKELRAVAYRRR
jgi:hypothetical protein